MNNTNSLLTLNEAGSLLLGAGLVQVVNNVYLGLTLVVTGAVLKIIVAILNKFDIPVSSPAPTLPRV